MSNVVNFNLNDLKTLGDIKRYLATISKEEFDAVAKSAVRVFEGVRGEILAAHSREQTAAHRVSQQPPAAAPLPPVVKRIMKRPSQPNTSSNNGTPAPKPAAQQSKLNANAQPFEPRKLDSDAVW